MGIFGTSESEESALRAAATASSQTPLGSMARSALSRSALSNSALSNYETASSKTPRGSMSRSALSHYETASEFSSQDFTDNESLPQQTISDDVHHEEDDDTTIQNLNTDNVDPVALHRPSGDADADVDVDVDVDADYVVPMPVNDSFDPSSMTENELNRIMTTPSTNHQAESLRRSISRSRTHGEYIDPNDLEWDGPDDKENPYNWPSWKKWFVTLVTAYTCLCISLGSSLYVEGVPGIMAKMHISQTLGLSGLTFYLIGLALGPVFAAPLSEMIGRRNIYITSFPFSMLFTMGVGLSQNIRSILILRFFTGLIASPPMSIAGGTISDIWGNSPVDIAIAMAFFCVAPFLGPVIGPIVGGFAVDTHGWRFTMWVSLIFSGAVLPLLLLCPETYKLAILKRRAKKRGIKLVETTIDFAYLKQTVQNNLVRPLEMLFVEPIVGLTSIYIAFVFAVLFGFFEAFPIIFIGVYKMSGGVQGLPFIGVGVGLIIGVLVYVLDIKWRVRKAKKAAIQAAIEKQKRIEAGEVIEEKQPAQQWVAPEKKLSTAAIGAVFLPISLFWLGWTSRRSIHWISATLSGVPFGFGLIWVFFGVVLYYSLSFPPAYVASALAANNFLRYIMASVFPLFIVQMYDKLHIDWATSLLAFIALAMVPIPLLFMKYGAKLREHSKYGYVAYFKKMAQAKAAAEATNNNTVVASDESSQYATQKNAGSESDQVDENLETDIADKV